VEAWLNGEIDEYTEKIKREELEIRKLTKSGPLQAKEEIKKHLDNMIYYKAFQDGLIWVRDYIRNTRTT
jgi:hypothetical protein